MDAIIIRYLRGMATQEEKKQLLEWLQQNEENKKIFSDMRDVWLASGNNPHYGSVYRGKAFKRFIGNVESHKRRRNRLTLNIFLRIAAIIVFLFLSMGIGYYVGQYQKEGRVEHAKFVTMNHFLMGNDSKGPITLPDGTLVWLHENSKLSYPEVFDENSRKVYLQGEAYFEVTENKNAPFQVQTNDITINVLGTCFNIKSYDYQPNVETVLLSGKINVFLPSIGESILMQPNQQILWSKENNTYKLTQVNADDYIIWINDRLAFTNEKLESIFFKMERWYNIRISCDPRVNLDQRLSFAIRRESKEEIFKLLTMIASICYQADGEEIKIYPQ